MAVRRSIGRWFRTRRNKALSAKIGEIAKSRNGPVNIIDVGGSPFFWETVPDLDLSTVRVTLVNYEESRDREEFRESHLKDVLNFEVGDGRALPHKDGAFDLAVCNSVIEHVGTYADMKRVASELERVARAAWVQVPAYGFPVEPHFSLPFVHWLGQPTRSALVRFLLRKKYRNYGPDQMRALIEDINLLSHREFMGLFTQARYKPEKVLFLTKSHIAIW